MRRTICGVFVLGLAVAACGGGNNNATHSCGDGHVDADEECDDGNGVSNDGCSAVCKIETSHCGDGITEVATEQCDDGNNVSGDGCSATCQRETVPPMNCGNGMIDAGEACDDHNLITGDGCNATCQVETGYTCTGAPSVCTMIPTGEGTCGMPIEIALTGTTVMQGSASGDTTSATNQVNGDCDTFPDDSLGNDQILTFTLPTASPASITLDSGFDGNIRLLAAPCDVSTAITDANEVDGCADGTIGETEHLTYAMLAAGTYYVVVDSFDPQELGTYTVSVYAGPMCGNGHLDPGEECDDSNTVAGDRCSATCTLESDLAEVEPNNTTGQVITPVHHQIRGALTAGDADLFSFTLTTAATVEFETYDSMDLDSPYEGFAPNLPDADCETISTTLTLFDSTGIVTDNTTGLYTDDFDGDFDELTFATCGYLGPSDLDGDTMQGVLGPGTYTIKVEETNGEAQTRYILDMKVTP